jgi:ribosomal peptide maturation radical SAM protein 1
LEELSVAIDDSVTTGTRIALVNMPFAMADRPSIQCGLLKAAVQRAGHEADIFYLNLELAAELGAELYRHLAVMRADQLLGEWLFSKSAFDDLPEEAEYLRAFYPTNEMIEDWGVDVRYLCTLRNETLPAWIDRWATAVDWERYSVVGFTTTFEQNNAAFALARRIKERHPQVVILFGGANFDGTMGKEYVRVLPFIDYAVCGEGDRVLPELVGCIARGESPLKLRGVIGRDGDALVDNGLAPRIEDMDSLPDPDYSEYFATLFRLGTQAVTGNAPPLLLFETSRGCWWGAKQHCTFCGLSASGMKFRAKSPTAALGQLERLSRRYKINNFEAVDNIIDYHYIEELCKPLAEQRLDYRIFYEVKANLHPRQLSTMVHAGIDRIQPGIESLNTHILALMRKGTTMLRNVRLLKWAHYYGMQVSWNILTGFPGETETDYAEQARVIPLLQHLPPPSGASRIWLERFSPYFFDSTFPVSDVKPLQAYRFVYPEHRIDLKEVAYFFTYEMDDTLPNDHHGELRDRLRHWKKAWKQAPRPSLSYQRTPEWIQVVDRRSPEIAAYSFTGWEADVYEMCGEVEQSAESLARHLTERGDRGEVSAEQVSASLERFCDLGLMLQEKSTYLSLALPVNRHW